MGQAHFEESSQKIEKSLAHHECPGWSRSQDDCMRLGWRWQALPQCIFWQARPALISGGRGVLFGLPCRVAPCCPQEALMARTATAACLLLCVEGPS